MKAYNAEQDRGKGGWIVYRGLTFDHLVAEVKEEEEEKKITQADKCNVDDADMGK